jgi:hypothetical protein
MKNKEGVGNRNADPKPMSESEEGVGVVREVRRRSAGGDRVDTESTEGGAREVRGRCEVEHRGEEGGVWAHVRWGMRAVPCPQQRT